MGSGRSIGILTILNAAGAVVALATSVVVAYFFGTARALEAFFAASTLQMIVGKLSQTGQLGEVFLPIYHRTRRDAGRHGAHGAFSVLLNWTVLSVAAVSAALWFLAPGLLGLLVPGFAAADRALGVRMFRWLLGLIVVQVVLSLVQTLANAERRFGRAEAVGVAARAVILIATAALAGVMGIWAMVAALWAGRLVQLAGYAVMLKRMGYRHRLRLRQEGFSAWSVFRKLGATLGYVGATQVYTFALDAGLSLLPQGTYAVFKYVQRLYAKTNSVLLRPVSVVFFTHFSEALARGAANVRALARAALARCLGIGVLVIVAVVVSGRPLLAGLWGSRRFGADNVVLAYHLLCVFYLLLLASALAQIARKTTMSLGMVNSQYLSTCLVQLTSAAAAWWLIGAFGVGGAMATMAFNAAALAGVPLVILVFVRPDAAAFYSPGGMGRWLVAGAVALAVGLTAGAFAPAFLPADLLAGRVGQLVLAAGLAGATVLVCLTAAWLMNIYEVRETCRRLRAHLAPGRGAGAGAARRTGDGEQANA